MDVLKSLPGDAKVVDCAGCGRTLIAKGEPRTFKDVPREAGRVLNRPYCEGCLEVRKPPESAAPAGDPSPWTENAVRALEGE